LAARRGRATLIPKGEHRDDGRHRGRCRRAGRAAPRRDRLAHHHATALARRADVSSAPPPSSIPPAPSSAIPSRRLSVRAGLGGLLLLVGAACATTPPSSARSPDEGPTKTAYLVSHGWHVGIVVARADVSPSLWPEAAALAPFRYVEVGWGDGTFYPSAEGTVGLALKAALRSESSVLHVAAFDLSPPEFFAGSTVIPLPLSSTGFDVMTGFFRATYARDANGQPTIVAPGLYGHSHFYRAVGRYRLFDNSNTWTARALHAAGCPIDPGIITASGVLEAARTFGRC
jgi:uncharacterized protein (TIGR02117 family)